MYYAGMPFVEWNLITNLSDKESYFKKKEIEISRISINIYEYKCNRELRLIIYENPSISYKEIIKYHEHNYSNLLCHICEEIAEKVIRTTYIENGDITGYRIIKYDSLWRDVIEQSLDRNMLLCEYRKIYYKNNERSFMKEKIFFADPSFSISEENYDW